MPWHEVRPQAELPQVARHVDYGVRRPILAQKGDRVLIVSPGHSHWTARGERAYAPTELQLTLASDQWDATVIHQGRLTATVLRVLALQIARWLGVTVEELPPIHRRKTFVWQDGA